MSTSGARSSVQIRTATTADADAVAMVLADAFVDDPVMGWLVPDRRRRATAYLRFFDLETKHRALNFASSLIASVDGKPVAAALVLPPESWRMPIATQIKHGRDFGRVFRGSLPRALRLQLAMERSHPTAPHVYLPFIGTIGASRGAGVGSALLRSVTDHCDGVAAPAYLEETSPANARLYRRHGFKTINHITVGGCPPLEQMWREPQQTRSAS